MPHHRPRESERQGEGGGNLYCRRWRFCCSPAENPEYKCLSRGCGSAGQKNFSFAAPPIGASLLSELPELSRQQAKLNPLGIIYKRKSSCTLNSICALLGNKMAAGKKK